MYVVIDEPNTAAQDDSSLVLGLAKKIMSQAFPYLNVTTVEGYDPGFYRLDFGLLYRIK
ncbi:Uncharacterised protein [Dorea longicatena]|nr:Uncharacterised protein [Dorea longicatena]